MGWFDNTDLQRKITSLEVDISYRDRMIESLTADLNRLREEKTDEVRNDVQRSTFVIDWRNMDAFSIERMGDVKEAYTIIGYYTKDEHGQRKVKEWKFYCSNYQHEKLAKEFAEYTLDQRALELKRYERMV